MLLIKGIELIDPETESESITDILIDGDRILKIKENIAEDDLKTVNADPEDEILCIDGTKLTAAPGLVDVHVHFRDPGLTYKEDILTGAMAAKAGGYTSVVCMANTKPVVDNTDTLEYVIKKGQETGINIYQAGAITKGLKGAELTDMEELLVKGAPGFTDDGIPILDEKLAAMAMREGARLNVPLSFHEEDPAYIGTNGVNQGKASSHFGIKGSDRKAEITMVKRDVDLALETGAIINIQHISTKEGVEIVRNALKAKPENSERKIHAEACPHHFTLTEEAVIEHGTNARMNPPLREESDRLAIIEGLKDGTIDIIATDHAPHSKEEKDKPITEAPSGIIGLETALALGITELVDKGYLSLMELIQKMTINPAKMYKLDAGCIKEGGVADIVIFDKNEEWTVPDTFESKASNTPFKGRLLKGKVKATICKGQIVYMD